MLRYYVALFGLSTLLQAQVNTPQVGFARFADGSVRPVLGLAASFVIGHPTMRSVDAASFSDVGGIISQQGHVRLLKPDGSVAGDQLTGDRDAVVNIEATPATAIAWSPASHSILSWDGRAFEKTDLPDSIAGKITSIRREGMHAKLLVLADKAVSELTVSLESGNLESTRLLPGVESAALQQKSLVVFADASGLEVEGSDGVRRTLISKAALDATDLTMERMASDWIHLRSGRLGREWALHVTPTLLDISQLPSAVVMDGAK